jgi:hypothetical protein
MGNAAWYWLVSVDGGMSGVALGGGGADPRR